MEEKNVQMMMVVPASEWNELNRKVNLLVEMQRENAEGKGEYLTPKEVCEMLKIGRATYERHRSKGTIPVYSIAGTKRKYAKKSDILRLLHEGKR